MNRHKVQIVHSICFKIQLLMTVGVVMAVAMVSFLTFPDMQQNVKDISWNYLSDQAVAYGSLLEAQERTSGEKLVHQYEYLDALVGDVSVEGCDTSYAYVVDKDGTMLYHPVQEKVGQPVENSVVKGLIADLQAGKDVTSGCEEYQYNGTEKYASYYIPAKKNFILVVTVDSSEIFAPIRNTFIKVVFVSVFAVLIVMAFGIFVSVRMLKPLGILTQIINKTAQLDFTPNPEQEKINQRKDETGMIGRAVSALHKELKEMIGILNGQSMHLSDTNDAFNNRFAGITENVNNINMAVEEIAQGSTSQAEETTSAGVQVGNIGNVIEENAKNAERLEDTVKEMNRLSDQADEMLRALAEINQKTSENIGIVSEKTNTTNDSAAKIKEAVVLIQDIARQTNLLSLNASIEAARAGEAGRGFAVVAEEIRKLADDSAESAGEIDKVVKELIENSNSSVEKMSEVTADAKEQKERLEKTQVSFESLRKGVGAISEVSQNIYVQTENLEHQKNIINGVVEQLAAISEENAASTQETSASMQTLSAAINDCKDETVVLSNLSRELNAQMSKFKM